MKTEKGAICKFGAETAGVARTPPTLIPLLYGFGVLTFFIFGFGISELSSTIWFQ
jgi:hypothetical protein